MDKPLKSLSNTKLKQTFATALDGYAALPPASKPAQKTKLLEMLSILLTRHLIPLPQIPELRILIESLPIPSPPHATLGSMKFTFPLIPQAQDFAHRCTASSIPIELSIDRLTVAITQLHVVHASFILAVYLGELYPLL